MERTPVIDRQPNTRPDFKSWALLRVQCLVLMGGGRTRPPSGSGIRPPSSLRRIDGNFSLKWN